MAMDLAIFLIAAAFGITLNEFRPRKREEVAETLIALEREALDRWGKGDPSGFLAISDPSVVYFDPYQERRIDGLLELTNLYEKLRGQVKVDRYELLNPHVQAGSDMAVLTFNLASHTGGKVQRWNCTEVYRHTGGQWRIIQSHWSLSAGQGT
jgi:hypothetical protein